MHALVPGYRRIALLAAMAAVAAMACAVLAPRADALVYWGTTETNAIARADLNGKNVKKNFIRNVGDVVAIATSPTHIYWADYDSGDIGRAKLDGTGVRRNFIPGPPGASGIHVTKQFVYWTNLNENTIGRANIDGSSAIQGFILPGPSGPHGIGVTGGFMYWTNFNNGSIGRAQLDGNGALVNFIDDPGVNAPRGLAFDSSRLYWSNGDSSVGRVDMGGTNFAAAFLAGTNPRDVAHLDAKLYWTRFGASTIGRANVSGGGVNNVFISNADNPWGIDLDGIKVAKASLKAQKPKVNRSKGTVTVKVNGPGTVTVSGRGIEKVSKTVKKINGGKVKIKFLPDMNSRNKIVFTGFATVKATIKFKSNVNRKARKTNKSVTFRS